MRISDWSSDVCSSDLQAFGEGRDEDHRHRELLQNVVHRVDARASVTELNVCKYDAGPRLGDSRQGFLVRGGRSADLMPKLGPKLFQLHRDQRFILDDKDGRRRLPFDLGERKSTRMKYSN